MGLSTRHATDADGSARTADFLRNVGVLAGLPDDLLERLAGRVGERRIRAGQWVMRRGDSADSLFIVRSGRVEVVDEGPPETLIRDLRRGDVVGELALLHDGVRTASVRASRDVVLIELGRADFEAMVQEAPSFALGLTRSLGAQLAMSRTTQVAATPPRTIVVVGLDRLADSAAIALRLADALGAGGSVARLSSGDLGEIDRARDDCDRVVLSAGEWGADSWTELCVREADLVLAVAGGDLRDNRYAGQPELRGCELLVRGPAALPNDFKGLAPRGVQVISRHGESAIDDAIRGLPAGSPAGPSEWSCPAAGHERSRISAWSRNWSPRGWRSTASRGSASARWSRWRSRPGTPRSRPMTRPRAVSLTATRAGISPPTYSLLRGTKARRLLREEFGTFASRSCRCASSASAAT